MLFVTFFALAYAHHGEREQVIEVQTDPSLVDAVRENPEAAAEAIAERDAALDAAMGEVRRLRVQNQALQVASGEKGELKPVSEATAIEQSLRKQGLPDRVPNAVARALVHDEAPQQPQAALQPAVAANPCMGHAWIFASLNDPNGYGPMGAVRCFIEENRKSVLVENRTANHGYVLLLNGLLVMVHNHSMLQLALVSEVPDVLTRAMQRAGVSSVPIIPATSRVYTSVPNLSGIWQFVRYQQDPITGSYDLDETCKVEEYDVRRHSGAWNLVLGAHRNDCDP